MSNEVSIEINGGVSGMVVGRMDGGTIIGNNEGCVIAPTYSLSNDGNVDSLKREISDAQKIISELNDISSYQKEGILDLLKKQINYLTKHVIL